VEEEFDWETELGSMNNLFGQKKDVDDLDASYDGKMSQK
jgi:hypothetical protein